MKQKEGRRNERKPVCRFGPDGREAKMADYRRYARIRYFCRCLGGGGLRTAYRGAGFDDPTSESSYADELLAGPLGRHVSDVVVLYESESAAVDDPAFADPVQQALSKLPRDGVVRLDSYWSTRDESFVSGDRHATYASIQLKSNDDRVRVEEYKAIKEHLNVAGLTVRFGGLTPMTEQVNAQIGRDIARAEMLSMPLLVLLLVFIFRSAVAAALPLILGIVVAVGSLAALRAVTYFTEISTFVINVVTILGLGLAIDYALFMVNRFREELAAGIPVDEAVERTMATAGRTVAFSGLTVGVSLACLLVFPSRSLVSMGFGGVLTVLFAVVGSMTVLPVMLRFAGERVNSLRVPLPGFGGGKSGAGVQSETRGRWYRAAHAMMRRPMLSTAGIVLLLVALGLPFLGVNWARPGDWVLPVGADARAVTNIMGQKFKSDPAKIVTGVIEAPGAADSAEYQAALQSYMKRLSAVEGVTGAKVTGTNGQLARLTLNYKFDPMSREAVHMVQELRAQEPPAGSKAYFTGMLASRVDIVDMVISRCPGWRCSSLSFPLSLCSLRSAPSSCR
ncbi:MMPL family transporter [Paenibacillus sp. P25]|nr:MMPL family transporter [Paenibacillus sp. P25]